MYNETYLCDNAGNRVPPGVSSGDPVAGSGIKITDAAPGANHTQTVVAGATYKIMSDATANAAWLFGILTTATAANVIWFMPAGSAEVVIKIPSGTTTLHYQALAAASAYIVRLKD